LENSQTDVRSFLAKDDTDFHCSWENLGIDSGVFSLQVKKIDWGDFWSKSFDFCRRDTFQERL
jgi:hypothetical protein